MKITKIHSSQFTQHYSQRYDCRRGIPRPPPHTHTHKQTGRVYAAVLWTYVSGIYTCNASFPRVSVWVALESHTTCRWNGFSTQTDSDLRWQKSPDKNKLSKEARNKNTKQHMHTFSGFFVCSKKERGKKEQEGRREKMDMVAYWSWI